MPALNWTARGRWRANTGRCRSGSSCPARRCSLRRTALRLRPPFGADLKKVKASGGETVARYGRQSNKIALHGRSKVARESLHGSEDGPCFTRERPCGMAAACPFAGHSGFLLAKAEGSLIRGWVLLAWLSALLPGSQEQRALLDGEACR